MTLTTTTTTLVVILSLPSDALSVARLLRDARVYSTVFPVTKIEMERKRKRRRRREWA